MQLKNLTEMFSLRKRAKLYMKRALDWLMKRHSRSWTKIQFSELASVSKQFTAMGIVQLEKEGKLSYNDPLTKYFPELSFYKPITIDNLLHHTSGLPDYMSLFDKTGIRRSLQQIKMLEMLAKYKPELLFVPVINMSTVIQDMLY